MKIIALVGDSGTGKSHKAMHLASSRGIQYLIDDGLLIKGSKRIAGKSAKREPNRLSAVKRAIFFFEDHRDEVRDAILKEKPEKILILGTSDKMIQNIATNLGIGTVDEFTYIEQIATPEEIRLARYHRLRQGKHVIPLPTVELKRAFSGYFLDSMKTIIRRKDDTHDIGEKTIVRPTFSYMGNFSISSKAIHQITEYTAELHNQVHEVYKVRSRMSDDCLFVEVDLSVHLGKPILKIAEEVQTAVLDALETMTRISVAGVNIYVKNLNIVH